MRKPWKGRPNKLTPYRRHARGCVQGKNALNCECPIWVHGRVQGKFIRISLGTRSLDAANVKITRMLSGSPDPPPRNLLALPANDRITIAQSQESFLAAKADLRSGTQKNYRCTLKDFREFAERRGVTEIAEIRTSLLERFFQERKLRQRTKAAYLTFLRTWCNYCVNHEWIAKSPAKALSFRRPAIPARLPFTHEEIARILDAADRMQDPARTRAVVLVMLYTGMRISDTTFLERGAVDSRGILDFVVIKGGKPTRIPMKLQPEARQALEKIDPGRGSFYFVEGNWPEAVRARHEGREVAPAMPKGIYRMAIYRMRRDIIAPVLRAANVKGTPHSFRDTFAVNMLTEGVDIYTVSQFLGHSSVEITQKHYLNLVPSYRERMSQATDCLRYPIRKAS